MNKKSLQLLASCQELEVKAQRFTMNHGGGIRTNRASIQLAKETAIETYRNDDDQSDDHRQVGLKVPTEPTGYAEAIDCIEHI